MAVVCGSERVEMVKSELEEDLDVKFVSVGEDHKFPDDEEE